MIAERGADRLARTAAEVASRWRLMLEPAFRSSCHAYVAPTSAGTVLKVTSPEDDEADEEAEALELWGGDGAVRLLRHESGSRAMLLERARPGDDISGLPEHEATAIAVEVGTRLWRRAGSPFRWIGDHVPRWLDNAERARGPSAELIPLARRMHASLEVGRSCLVHGDLHHHNILATAGGSVAIDPKPMLGEREFDVPPFFWNPIAQRMTLDLAQARLEAFAAAGLDPAKMRAWVVIRGACLGVDEGDVAVLRALIS